MSKLDSIWATWAGRAGILAARPDFRLDPAVHGSTSMVETGASSAPMAASLRC